MCKRGREVEKKIEDRSEKESVRDKDSETDTDRARERSGGEAKYLMQQALLANACCDHDIKDHGSMSVEKGIVASYSDVAILSTWYIVEQQ